MAKHKQERDDRDFRILADGEDLYVFDARGLNDVEKGLAPSGDVPGEDEGPQRILEEKSKARKTLAIDLVAIAIVGLAVGIAPALAVIAAFVISMLWFWVVGGNRVRKASLRAQVRLSADDGGSPDLVPIDAATAASASQEELLAYVEERARAMIVRDGREIIHDLPDDHELRPRMDSAVETLLADADPLSLLPMREGELEDPGDEAEIWLEEYEPK